VSASDASVIVNEINCKDGTTNHSTPDGDWFEVVVVGNGTWSSTVDMRGWQFKVIDTNGNGYFKLSTNSYWSNVRAGTIITFHEDNTAGGGADTSILGTNNFNTLGWGHTNVYTHDAAFIDVGWASHDPGFALDNSNSQVAVENSAGAVVFGPAGEGVAPASGVGSDEVFKLQADPSPSITNNSAFYADGSTDTFGRPNEWTTGGLPNKQSFLVFVPEPSGLLLALGALPLLGMRRRRA
jgi:hypothetical protein